MIEYRSVDEARRDVIAAGHELVKRGLVSRTWGNVSCRVDARRFAITPSGMSYDRMTESDIAIVDAETLDYEGNSRPSSEKRIHAAVYRQRADASFVVHTHQTFATVMSVAGFDNIRTTPEESSILGGKILLAGYGFPGSKLLYENVNAAIGKGSSAILMARHGALLIGTSKKEAFARAELLEKVCREAVQGAPKSLTDVDGDKSFIRFPNLIREFSTAEEILYKEIRRLHPLVREIYRDPGSVADCMGSTILLPAMIDDYAQMVGSDIRVMQFNRSTAKHDARAAARALSGRNCVIVKGLGAICCAGNIDDCKAIAALVEKNALTYLNASYYGMAVPLALFDRWSMRSYYKLNYARKK